MQWITYKGNDAISSLDFVPDTVAVNSVPDVLQEADQNRIRDVPAVRTGAEVSQERWKEDSLPSVLVHCTLRKVRVLGRGMVRPSYAQGRRARVVGVGVRVIEPDGLNRKRISTRAVGKCQRAHRIGRRARDLPGPLCGSVFACSGMHRRFLHRLGHAEIDGCNTDKSLNEL